MRGLEYYYSKLLLYCINNPYVLKPQHIALYCYAMHLQASLGYPECFGLPTTNTMMHLGIKKYESYSRYLKVLTDAKLFFVLEYSTNQYTANVITLKEKKSALPESGKANQTALPENGKANDAALPKNGKAKINAQTLNTNQKQSILDAKTNMQDFCFAVFCDKKVSIIEEEEDINKPSSSNKKNALPENGNPFIPPAIPPPTIEDYKTRALKDKNFMAVVKDFLPDMSRLPGWLAAFNTRLLYTTDVNKTEIEYRNHFIRWLPKIPNYKTMSPSDYKLIQDNTTTDTLTPTELEFLERRKHQKT